MVDALHALRYPWILRLRQLPVGSPLAARLMAGLSTTAKQAGSRRYELHFVDDRPPARWLSRNTGRALAKARNRISREGHRLEVRWVEASNEIEDMFPELVRIHRARDLDLRCATLLDDAQEFRFFDQVFHRHAGQWRLLAVNIDDSLAAYALCLMDGATLRVWDNRVAPGWRRYSAGTIANAEVVLRAAADESIRAVDWGCGEQRYKTSLSNDVIDAEDLTAWSSPVLRAALACRSRLPRPKTHGATSLIAARPRALQARRGSHPLPMPPRVPERVGVRLRALEEEVEVVLPGEADPAVDLKG
jgi:CelD/BcsL family acetyltransferase involved in cellulose biosynthesis